MGKASPRDSFDSSAELVDTPAERRKIAWALDLRTMPMLSFLWLMAFIDRSNIGNARIAGLSTDLGLVGNQFNIALAVFYVLYIVFELPSNLFLKKIGGHIWIPSIVIAWGVVTTLTCLVQNYAGLLAVRIFLGLCEGGVLPGIVLYLSFLYPRHELQFRIATFYAAASISGAFGGLLASGIIQMNGLSGLAGWRYIFMLEGIVTVVGGVVALFVLPRDLQTAKFLTPAQRELAVRRLHHDITPTAHVASEKDGEAKVERTTGHHDVEKFEWYEFRRGFLEPQVWLSGIAYCCICVSLYSYSLFLPTIITGLGFSGTIAQLRTVPPYVPATVMCVLVAIAADRSKKRGPFILALLPISMVGYIMLIASRDNQVRYAAVFLIALGIYPSVPCLLSWLVNNASGHTKRATVSALQLMLCNLAGFIATFIYETNQAPDYVKAHSIVLGHLILAWILFAINELYCIRENRLRASGKRDGNIAEYERLVEAGVTKAPIGDRSPHFVLTT